LLNLTVRERDTTFVQEDFWGNERVISRGRSAELVTNSVCTGCNTGWMSALENDVAEFFTQMIFGKSVLIGQRGTLIATWLMKTAMVEDTCPGERERHFDQREREQFRRALLGESLANPFPSLTAAWIGACRPMSSLYTLPLPGTRKALDRNHEDGAKFYTFTFAAGHLVLQLYAASLPFEKNGVQGLEHPFNGYFNDHVECVYPIVPSLVLHRWPPAKAIERPATSLDYFAKRWAVPID
jgi:hypothetical protein